jgi:hypothetical protein
MFEELIKAELKKRGLSEGLCAVIKVEKAEDIAGAVDIIAKDVDRRVSGAVTERDTKIATLTTELETAKKTPAKGGEPTKPDPKTGGDPDLATLVKTTVTEALSGLTKTFEETYGKKLTEITAAQKMDAAKAKLKESGLDPEKFIRFVDLEKIEESVKEVSDLFQGEKQKAIDDALVKAGRPISGNVAGTTDAAITEYAKAKNAGAPLGGSLPAKAIPGVTAAAAPE